MEGSGALLSTLYVISVNLHNNSMKQELLFFLLLKMWKQRPQKNEITYPKHAAGKGVEIEPQAL